MAKFARKDKTTNKYVMVSRPDKYPEADYIFNENTGRFVKRKGTSGRKAAGTYRPRQARAAENYILNPQTGKQVLRTGAVGKRILAVQEARTQKHREHQTNIQRELARIGEKAKKQSQKPAGRQMSDADINKLLQQSAQLDKEKEQIMTGLPAIVEQKPMKKPSGVRVRKLGKQRLIKMAKERKAKPERRTGVSFVVKKQPKVKKAKKKPVAKQISVMEVDDTGKLAAKLAKEPASKRIKAIFDYQGDQEALLSKLPTTDKVQFRSLLGRARKEASTKGMVGDIIPELNKVTGKYEKLPEGKKQTTGFKTQKEMEAFIKKRAVEYAQEEEKRPRLVLPFALKKGGMIEDRRLLKDFAGNG